MNFLAAETQFSTSQNASDVMKKGSANSNTLMIIMNSVVLSWMLESTL